MSKLVQLKISNFRGIKELSINFNPDKKFTCFVGRGDSGKSTILEAISTVFSPSWNLAFYDTDFYNCDTKNPIIIEASIIEFNEKLLSEEKYGLHLRNYNFDSGELSDNILADSNESGKPALTIRLRVDKMLEPTWTVSNTREQEDKPISASDRQSINCFLVSDYLDRHFSWNKGNPLSTILNSSGSSGNTQDSTIIIDSLRAAKNQIDDHPFSDLNEVTDMVRLQAELFGLRINNLTTSIDWRELSIKDGRISLHENKIPVRMKGKGSRRLASLAIQSATMKSGGIILVDEIEQGLEPDRIKNLIRTLSENSEGQVFLTTHSREVITELEASDLRLVLKDDLSAEMKIQSLDYYDKDRIQRTVRACSEAFFAKKVIVCEGKTELGICRSLDKYRRKEGNSLMSFKDCAYVLGEGNSLYEHTQNINQAYIKTSLLCDSDDPSLEEKKPLLKSGGVTLFECEAGLNIERQIFQDLPWEAILEIITNATTERKIVSQDSLVQSLVSHGAVNASFKVEDPFVDSPELRIGLAKVATTKKREWFKRIDLGENLGDIIFKHWDQIDNAAHLKILLIGLSNWIDE